LADVADRGLPALPALAHAGHQLYQSIFPDDPAQGTIAEIRTWLTGLAGQALEIVSDVPGLVPWNVVYDRPADESALAGGNAEALRAFWGIGYGLTTGRRVNAWRQIAYLEKPEILLVVDPALRHALAEDRQRLAEFSQAKSLTIVESKTGLDTALQAQPPDFVYLLCRSHAHGFWLGDDLLAAGSLLTLLQPSGEDTVPPLVFLDVSGTVERPDAHLARALGMGLDGLITCEQPAPAARSQAFAVDFLSRFLYGGESLATALQKARATSPAAGLAFSAFCPPGVRVTWEEAPAEDVDAGPEPEPLPEEPYRPLAPYDREERALFGGRDDEVARFAAQLDRAATRLVVLHGSTACGKSSFLRAGVLPYLEDVAIGFRALRDRTPEETPLAEDDYPVLAIRASSDLAGQLAEAICAFCEQPFTYTTPVGTTVTVNLPGILNSRVQVPPTDAASTAVREISSPEAIQTKVEPAAEGESGPPPVPGQEAKLSPRDLWEALQNDVGLLARLLAALSEPLPHELVIVVEQGEGLFTQVSKPVERRRRRLALDMLVRAAATPGKYKLIVSLRTEFFGRLAHELTVEPPRLALLALGLEEFFLAPLSREKLIETMLLPTAAEPIACSSEIPCEKYHFSFEEGVPQAILEKAGDAGERNETLLPAIQATCARLYDTVKDRSDTVIRADDLRLYGKAPDAYTLRNHVDRLVNKLFHRSGERLAFRELCGSLVRREADGTLTRRLVSLPALREAWSGRVAIEQMLDSACDSRLLELNRLLIGGKEGLYAGLSQDALCQVAASWSEDKKGRQVARSRTIDMLWVFIPLMFLVAALTLYFTRQAGAEGESGLNKEKDKLVEQQQRLQAELQNYMSALYPGHLSLADQAAQTGNTLRLRQLLLGHQGKERERGFEWYYLWQQGQQQRRSLVGHRGLITAVALAPDGKAAASASLDGTVKLWDLAGGQILATLTGHKGPVHAVAFSGDGKTLVSAGADKTVQLWDVSPAKDYVTLAKPKQALTGHTEAVLSVAFSQDNATIASGSADKTVILWDVVKGEKRIALEDHGGPVHAVAFAPDGKTLASTGADGVAYLWTVPDGKKRHTLKAHSSAVAVVAFSPDGKLLASGGSDRKDNLEVGTVRFWDADTGKASLDTSGQERVLQHSVGVFALAFGGDGSTLASGGKDNLIRLWNTATGQAQGVLKGHLGWVRALVLARDGRTVISGSYDQSIKVWDAGLIQADVHRGHKDWVCALAFAPDGKLLASGSRDGAVLLWDPAGGTLPKALDGIKGAVLSLAFAPRNDSLRLAAGIWRDKKGEIKVWELARVKGSRDVKAKELYTLKGHEGGVACVAISADGKTLVSGGGDKTIKVWDLDSGKEKHTLAGHKAAVRCLTFISGTSLLASGADDGTIRLWETGAGKELGQRETHRGPVTCLLWVQSFVRDEKGRLVPQGVLVSGSNDQTVKLWGVDLSLSATLRGHRNGVLALALGPRGELLSAGWDETIKLWDINDPNSDERFTFTGHTGAVRALAVSADGRTMASAGNDGTVRLWRAAPEDVLAPEH
jgi:WD40 repeat protein